MDKRFYQEPSRTIPWRREVDVIVAGAGPAGIAAALAAARQGARTALLEAQGALGGVWTSGLLSWIIDAGDKPGIMREITAALEARGARAPKGRNFAYDVEEMKVLLEELAAAEGIHVRLHTRVCAVVREGRAMRAVITESKSGREVFGAEVFIDASGDGDLAAQAGCRFAYGDPKSGRAQPMSLIALVTGIHAGEIPAFVGGGVLEAKVNLFDEFRRAGVSPSYSRPTLFRIRDDLFALMANHEYGVSPMDADEITRSTIHARAELRTLVAALRRRGGPWSGLRIVATGAQIGVREGRRVAGRYEVSADDIFAGRRHEDGICRVHAGIDVHSVDPGASTAYQRPHGDRASLPYDIPLRALIAADVDGLMMAGRCISGDFLAHSSYRMTGNAVAMGEAAGITAALAAARGVAPHELAWENVAPFLPGARTVVA
ncbi:MAG TPA: FAD-dependent oxidoreductase [Chthoniobacteraceae bacterium]|nr:FAD-dependent oxidoreductase [Chthoniobacteraceae bacterium]